MSDTLIPRHTSYENTLWESLTNRPKPVSGREAAAAMFEIQQMNAKSSEGLERL